MIWLLLSLVGLVAILPLRLVQINTTTSNTFNIIYAIVTILIILCFLIPLWLKKIQIKQSNNFKSKISGFIAMVLAVLFVIDGFYNFSQFLKNHDMNLANFLITLFEILAALFFALYMFPYHFRQKKVPSFFALSALFPVLWLAAQMLNVFLQSTTGISVAQHSFTILADAFALLFFFSQARVLSNIERGKGHRGMLLYGYLSSLFLIISTISNFVYTNQLFEAMRKGTQITDYLIEGTPQQVTTQDKTLIILGLCVNVVLCLYVLSVTLVKNFSKDTGPYEDDIQGKPEVKVETPNETHTEE